MKSNNPTTKKKLLRIGIRVLQILSLVAIAFGSLFIGIGDYLEAFGVESIFDLSPEDRDYLLDILVISRLPRLISILITGTSLAIAGLIMQSITSNRFVSPSTAGTMEWCKFGVMIAILVFPDASTTMRVGVAFLVSLVGTAIFLAFIKKIQTRNIILVPLLGIMLGSIVSAGTTFFAYQYDISQNMSSWLQGSFALIIEGDYELVYLSLPFMIIAYLYSDNFTIAGMGKNMTVALGLNHTVVVAVGLFIVAVITSISIVSVGYIPFIGLIVPNIVSILRGDSVKHTLFDTAYLGAMLLLLCDIAGRMLLAPYEIPVGVILSVVGSVIFLILLRRKKTYA